MSRPHVVVVGSLNRDYVCRVEALPSAGQTVVGDEAVVGSGGKGANQAVAASLLGAPTAMVGRVGDDEDGRSLVDGLRAAGVDTGAVSMLPGVRTGMAFVLVAADGENCIAVAPGANSRLDADEAVGAVRSLLAPTGILVTQAEIPEATFRAVVEAAAERGCRAVVNLAPYRPVPESLLRLCDPLVVNESEAGALLGRGVRGADDAEAAAGELFGRTRSVVVTVGAEGAVLAGPDGVERVPAPTVEVVDTTGAGDAFTGALAAALSRGGPLAAAVRLGVRAGAHSVARPGAQASYATAADLAH
ncbi:MAG TPA: ribokinase [Marmoricola sp.]|nr:ribokinase [Marmoricola sp.]